MIRLPSIGVGCAAPSIISLETGDEAVVEMLVGAYARGVRYFDVAPLYGGGRGEVLLGRALARMADPVIVSTKAGYTGAIPYGGRQAPGDRRKDFSPSAIERSVVDSLRRLNRDSVDIVLLHDPDGDLDDITKFAIPTLERLRGQGIIRAIGVGTTKVAVAQAALDRWPISVLLLAGRCTLIDRGGEETLERCSSLGVQGVVAGIFNSGLLAADSPARGGTFDYAPAPASMVARADRAYRLCAQAGLPLKAVAAQFARRRSGVVTTLLGPRTHGELEELLSLLDTSVPASVWDELDRLALAELSG